MSSDFSSIRTGVKPTVIFLHIRKTAGSTLNKIIEHQYKRIFSLAEYSIDEFRKLPEAFREKIRAIQGHMYYGIHEYLPRPSIYITMVRDPIDRIISHYYMILRSSHGLLHREVVSRRMSLKDFAGSGLTGELENGQTKLLAGIDAIGAAGSFQQCSSGILETAKINLQGHFAVVGLSDRFDESLILLKRAFGWKNIFYVNRHIGTNRPKKEEIPREALECIEKHNELDIKLFRYAKERLDETIRREGPSFDRELREFRSLNNLYGKFHRNYYQNLYEFLRPVTTGVRRWMKNGRAVCLMIVSTSLFESLFFALDDIF